MIFCLSSVLLLIAANSFANADKYISGDNTDKSAAIQFMEDTNRREDEFCDRKATAIANYKRDKTEKNLKLRNEISDEYDAFDKQVTLNATTFAWKNLENDNPLAYRWFKLNALLQDLALTDDKSEELSDIIFNMTNVLDEAKVCNLTDNCAEPTLEIIPDLDLIMGHSTDYDELRRVWVAYRDATGKQVRDMFFRYVDLKNEAAVLNGFADNGEVWKEAYESDTFEQDVENLWNTITPFYQQLHAYARKKLMTRYPGKIKPDGPIPAQILGNMWSATWQPLQDFLKPYPNAEAINVTQKMIEKGMTVRGIFDAAEEFFTSLGLSPMPAEFWENTVMVKPENESSHCTAYASVICKAKGVRITMCGRVTLEDMYVVHHEMGHIEYFLQYADQPIVFQKGANPGFHEAVGDAVALSVNTPAHLKEIGILDEIVDTPEADLNYLMQTALDKIAFLPFAYLMDLYRWQIFDGTTTSANLNRKWWELELDIQGICPPVRRTEEDFDAASLFHVVGDFPYVRYFVSFIIQFQFHKALCKEAGYTGPLYKCDIYRSKAAGNLLKDVLSKGRSVAWNEAMSIMTKGETNQMDASALIEYFQPLITWLENENQGETIGWTSSDPTICPTP